MLELSLYSLLSHPGFTFDINNTTTYINPESMKVAVHDRYCSRIHSFQAWIFSDEAVKNSFLRYKPFERYTSEISTVHGKTWHCIMEYGSTPYVGMGTEKNGFPIKCVQNNMFRTQL